MAPNHFGSKRNSQSKMYESILVYPPSLKSKFNVRGLGFTNESTRILADNDPLVNVSNNLYNSCHPLNSQKEIQYERCHKHNKTIRDIMKMELNKDMLKLLDNFTVSEPRSAFFKCFSNLQLKTVIKLMESEMHKLLPIVTLLDEFIETGHLLYKNRPEEIIEKNDPIYRENGKSPFVTLDVNDLNEKWSKIDHFRKVMTSDVGCQTEELKLEFDLELGDKRSCGSPVKYKQSTHIDAHMTIDENPIEYIITRNDLAIKTQPNMPCNDENLFEDFEYNKEAAIQMQLLKELAPYRDCQKHHSQDRMKKITDRSTVKSQDVSQKSRRYRPHSAFIQAKKTNLKNVHGKVDTNLEHFKPLMRKGVPEQIVSVYKSMIKKGDIAKSKNPYPTAWGSHDVIGSSVNDCRKIVYKNLRGEYSDKSKPKNQFDNIRDKKNTQNETSTKNTKEKRISLHKFTHSSYELKTSNELSKAQDFYAYNKLENL